MVDYLYFKVGFQCNSEEIESKETDISWFGGEIIKTYIKNTIFVVVIIATIFFGAYKFSSYLKYTGDYSYELQEIKDGTYAIYHSVSSNVPSHNYDVITVCYNDQIHMFQGTVNIQQTNNKPCIEIAAKPHINYGDEITVFIPKGTVEFTDNVGLK